tara:strand:- start:2642 stop:3409 length:768 start_codon:yes stop_codon:yes gene_type:complete
MFGIWPPGFRMKKARSSLKILLLQIREQQKVRVEEHQSFARYANLPTSQIDILNVFDTPTFSPDCLQGYDALFIGGASEASVLEPQTYPFIAPGIKLMQYCIDSGFPVFASCFGYQWATLALGGEVINDTENYEMGTVPILLTEQAREDRIFCDVPNGFQAVSVHQQKVLTEPEGCIALAYTDMCRHAFKVANKPFWACQFHPEVDKQTLIERLAVFKHKYTQGDDHYDQVISQAKETPESNDLIKKFVDRVLVG